MRTTLRTCLGCVALFAMFSNPARARAADEPTDEQKKATVAYVIDLGRDGGGFAEVKKADAPASVPATCAAIYALRYFGGEVKDKKACGKFVIGCRVAEKRAYAPTPGGKPDTQTTALAALALVELRGPGKGGVFRTINAEWGSYSMRMNPDGAVADKDVMDAVIDSLLLGSEAKTADDYRRFGEVHEAASRYGSIRFFPRNELLDEFKKQSNPDGTFGKGAVADTASAVIAIRGAGGSLGKAEQVARFLKEAQRADGGWGKDKSDLETTSAVAHAIALLRGECDVAACRKFIAKCRNKDGSYAPQPDQPGSAQATYHAGAILQRLSELASREK